MEAQSAKLNEGKSGAAHLLREIMRAHQAMVGGLSSVTGISSTRLGILRNVAVAGDRGVGIMMVARSMGLDAAAITRQVAAMENEGMLVRSDDPSDKRRVRVRLSAKGAELFETVHAQIHAYEKRLLAGITDGDVATTVRVLDTIRVGVLSAKESV